MMKKYGIFLASFLMILAAKAQGETGGGDLFSGHLKIYVSVAVLAIILGWIFVFLFMMEKRLKKLEDLGK